MAIGGQPSAIRERTESGIGVPSYKRAINDQPSANIVGNRSSLLQERRKRRSRESEFPPTRGRSTIRRQPILSGIGVPSYGRTECRCQCVKRRCYFFCLWYNFKNVMLWKKTIGITAESGTHIRNTGRFIRCPDPRRRRRRVRMPYPNDPVAKYDRC